MRGVFGLNGYLNYQFKHLENERISRHKRITTFFGNGGFAISLPGIEQFPGTFRDNTDLTTHYFDCALFVDGIYRCRDL